MILWNNRWIQENSVWTLELKILLSIKRNIFLIKTTFLVFIRRGRKLIMLAKNCRLWSLFTVWMNQLRPEKFRNIEYIMQQITLSGYVQCTFLIHFCCCSLCGRHFRNWKRLKPWRGILRNDWRYKKHVDKSFYFRIWLI